VGFNNLKIKQERVYEKIDKFVFCDGNDVVGRFYRRRYRVERLVFR
jgi:hypothetical protein